VGCSGQALPLLNSPILKGLMKTTGIEFYQLRAAVIALFDRGEQLKKDGGTFSHGNTGNDYQDLAHYLDQLVSSSEHHHRFLIIEQGEYNQFVEVHQGALRDQMSITKEWREKFVNLVKELGAYDGAAAPDFVDLQTALDKARAMKEQLATAVDNYLIKRDLLNKVKVALGAYSLDDETMFLVITELTKNYKPKNLKKGNTSDATVEVDRQRRRNKKR